MRIVVTAAKSIVLVALIATSLFQIGELWFEDNSDRNSFYNVLRSGDLISPSMLMDEGNLLQPSQLSVYIPGRDYTVIRHGAAFYEDITESSVEVIKDVLKKGDRKEEPINSEELWKKNHIMLKLPIGFRRGLIEANLNLGKNTLKHIGHIQNIIIVPGDESDPNAAVYLEDKETGAFHQFLIELSQVEFFNGELRYFISEVEGNQNAVGYTSALKEYSKYYNRNILLPKTASGLKYHDVLPLEVPFIGEDSFDEEALTGYVRHFFDNSDVVSVTLSDSEEQIYLRVPETGVVEYNRNGLVTYSRLTAEEPEFTNISIALGAAEMFIKDDVSELAMEYYLRKTVVVDDYVEFYYDIGYYDFPIVMDEDRMEMYELDSPYPMMVRVSGDEVVAFRRILRVVDEMVPQDRILEAVFTEVVDRFVEETGDLEPVFDDTYLAYKWNAEEEEIRLHWVVEIQGGERYFYVVD